MRSLIFLLSLTVFPMFFSHVSAQENKLHETNSTTKLSAGEEIDRWTSRDIAYVLSPIVSLLGVALIVYYTRRNVMAEQRLKANESEAEFIQNKLDKFYGPFLLVSNTNKLVAQDLRARQSEPSKHRLLERLFDEQWRTSLSAGDNALIKEICESGERLSNIVEDNAGLVSPEILPYLSRVMAHFRILKLAYDGKLGTDKQPFMRYVYPRSLDPVLEKELDRLRGRLALLREKPTESHGSLPGLDLTPFPLDDWPDPRRN